ncbi:MAG: ribonuclease activity regulator RraA [Chloroflexi bacterium]|nr:ribonuclease activity regulator RraA [Chloroflexota bacterium]
MLVEGLEPLSDGTFDALREATTASVTSELLKLGIRHSFMTGVAPLDPGMKMVGEAVTLRYVPAREDLDNFGAHANREHPQRKAIETIGRGEVLVIDARGELRSGTLGEILVARMQARGAAGFVTDGAVRDVAGIRAVGLAAFVGGVHASASPTIHHAADMNSVIGCGGIMVRPGDVIFGDSDGVVVIPRHLAAAVAATAGSRDRLEEYLLTRIQRGDSLWGVYPPNEDTLREYDAWRQTH